MSVGETSTASDSHVQSPTVSECCHTHSWCRHEWSAEIKEKSPQNWTLQLVDSSQIRIAKGNLQSYRRKENYKLVHIGNMDEAPVWFDMS